MGANGIFKSDFLNNMVTVSVTDTVIALILAFLTGIFIYEVYKKTHGGVMTTPNYGLSLIALTMISTFVILAVTTNVVLSLGMVGALSIVRFRTAIKDPLDIVFLFWSISAGIVLAAQMIFLAIAGSILIGVMMLIFCRKKNRSDMYVLILKCAAGYDEASARTLLQPKVKHLSLRNKIVSDQYVEIHYELFLKDENTSFVDEISASEGVNHAAMLSFNGDYTK